MSSYVEGYQITVWLAVGSVGIIAAFGAGLAFGRVWGLQVAPTVWRARALAVAKRLSRAVWRWREKWRWERAARETAQEDAATLRGAREVLDRAKRRTA